MTDPEYFTPPGSDAPIAYRKRDGATPTFLFLPGYASDMDGAKAEALDAFAAQRGNGLVRFDYSGTGHSVGDFADSTLEGWLDEATAVVTALIEGPLIAVGSSMGGWIALLLALRLPDRVKALVGIAAAPDFTQWGFTEGQKQMIVREGMFEEIHPDRPEPHRVHRGFWESAQRLRLLEQPIALDCPVRLIHGELDSEVPLDIGLRTMRQLRSADVQLQVIKGGDHRLSAPPEIAAILGALAGLLEPMP